MLGNYVKAVARFRTVVGGLLYKIPSNWSGVGSHGRSLGLSEFFWPRVPVATSPSHKPTETLGACSVLRFFCRNEALDVSLRSTSFLWGTCC